MPVLIFRRQRPSRVAATVLDEASPPDQVSNSIAMPADKELTLPVQFPIRLLNAGIPDWKTFWLRCP